ncbi:alpha/beta hydrolase, partial [Ruegeria sp. 2012CJ41-6]
MFERSHEVALNFQDKGDGDPVLMIHGVGSDLESWDGLLSYLSPDRRYIRFDLRGHGRSRQTPGPYTLQDFVHDAVALLDHCGIEQASLVGFSLGGLIAQAIALTHPRRVKNLSLISTVAGRSAEERQRVRQRADTLESEGADSHLADAVDRWFSDKFREANPTVLEARRRKSLENNPECYASAYRVLAENDLGPELSAIKCRTIISTGEHDIGSTPRMAEFIHRKIEGSTLHILPGLKHSLLLEAPDQLANIIDPFLSAQS